MGNDVLEVVVVASAAASAAETRFDDLLLRSGGRSVLFVASVAAASDCFFDLIFGPVGGDSWFVVERSADDILSLGGD